MSETFRPKIDEDELCDVCGEPNELESRMLLVDGQLRHFHCHAAVMAS